MFYGMNFNFANPNASINMYMVNSTESEDFGNVGICKSELDADVYPPEHVKPPLKWYYWVIIGGVVLIIIAIAANVLYWKFIRKPDPIERIANALKL